MKIEVEAEYLFQFNHFQSWVNNAPPLFKMYKDSKHVLFAIDKNGNQCHIGEDFRVAQEKDLFPVKVYRFVRTLDAHA